MHTTIATKAISERLSTCGSELGLFRGPNYFEAGSRHYEVIAVHRSGVVFACVTVTNGLKDMSMLIHRSLRTVTPYLVGRFPSILSSDISTKAAPCLHFHMKGLDLLE
jgi:hypothetical protein